jgi:hypothetical protein
MKATVLDMRRRMKDILAALDRNEEVTIFYRGKKKGVIYPVGREPKSRSIADHPAVGMWKDRDDLADVDTFVRKLRRQRHAV